MSNFDMHSNVARDCAFKKVGKSLRLKCYMGNFYNGPSQQSTVYNVYNGPSQQNNLQNIQQNNFMQEK